MKIRDSLVTEDKQFIVSLLQHCHPLAIDLELLTMEPDLGLSTLLHIALELVNNFVLFLVLVILHFDGLHVSAKICLFQLLLKRRTVSFMEIPLQ